jgi:hypothetical protein
MRMHIQDWDATAIIASMRKVMIGPGDLTSNLARRILMHAWVAWASA